ncbi:MAG: transporter substrate-binding domain-containing protein [Idiomarina sp.]|nr:transporter substrate-binding domain-containing protein [Idiomarina sp.]
MTSPTYVFGLWASVLLGLIGIATAGSVSAQNDQQPEGIYIAAYEFPPYFSSSLESHVMGALVKALNQRQQQYHFTITEVRPAHRYRALSPDGCCDLMLFQDPQWGWREGSNGAFIIGAGLTKGADLYLALDDPHEVLQGEVTIGGVQGYHYQLTGYQHDMDILEQDHNLYLADNHLTLLNMLRRERLDVVIMNEEMIRFMETWNESLLSDFDYQTAVDQEYETRIIGRQDRAELVNWLEAELASMAHEGKLAALFQRFGLQDHLSFDAESYQGADPDGATQ